MKPTVFFATAFIAAATLLASCDNDMLSALRSSNNASQPVRFTSRIATTPGTRLATDANGVTTWEEGDPIGIFMVSHGGSGIVADARNVHYQAQSAGTTTSFAAVNTLPISFPEEESRKVDFIAYHPYNAGMTDFACPVNVSEQSSQPALDLLYAKADNAGAGYTKQHAGEGKTVDYTFGHRLVKLALTVRMGAGLENRPITAVRINGMNTTATFDLSTATLSGAGTPADITPAGRGLNYEAILLPVDALKDAHTVTFTVDGTDYKWTMKRDIPNGKLEAGRIYQYTLTITTFGISATGDINAWTEGNNGNGYAQQS